MSGIGYVPVSLFILASISSVIFETNFNDPTISSSYSGFEALVIADETSLFLTTQAIASYA